MCGIAGSVCWNNVENAEYNNIKKIISALNDRGPDFSSVKNFGRANIGHARLSIIDLNKNANQPMFDTSSRYVISFNGEIYNFNEIKIKLISKGVIFKTKSDTEVILESYKQWKEKCLELFEGMFVFIIWDKIKETLFLARDRMGEKPVFFVPYNGKNFESGIIFSSELKALLLHPNVKINVDNNTIWEYLSLNYVLTSSCMITEVKKLEPGSFAVFTKNSYLSKEYWKLKSFFLNKRRISSLEDTIQEFNFLLTSTVKKQINSDVPLGAFLSGGVDSSTIVASANRVIKNDKFKTFCIGFDEFNYNEIPKSDYVSNLFNNKKFNQIISFDIKNNFLKILDKVCDEPLADTSIIPMFFLCKFARENITVALSGDGADEIFLGYETYLADKLKNVFDLLPMKITKFLHYFANRFFPVSHNKVSFDYKLKQFLGGCTLPKKEAHYWWRNIFSEKFKKEICVDSFAEGLDNPFIKFSKIYSDVKSCDFLDQVSYVDIKTWLVDSILMKVDRASMANSLECRAPFLSHKIVEFAASLPADLKLQNFRKKAFLRKSQASYLPKKILNSKKRGFNSPISFWLNNQLNKLGKEITFDSNITNIIREESIKKMWSEHEEKVVDHGHRLFGLVCLGHWLDGVKKIKK